MIPLIINTIKTDNGRLFKNYLTRYILTDLDFSKKIIISCIEYNRLDFLYYYLAYNDELPSNSLLYAIKACIEYDLFSLYKFILNKFNNYKKYSKTIIKYCIIKDRYKYYLYLYKKINNINKLYDSNTIKIIIKYKRYKYVRHALLNGLESDYIIKNNYTDLIFEY